jgi:two-component system, OmpR family, response regulator MtrA
MSKPRILIVDDDVALSRLVGLKLEKTSRYEVRVENRSHAALATAREFHPDFILLDVDMPGKDGGDVARELRADPEFGYLPIVFFTSLVSGSEGGGDTMQISGKSYLAKTTDVTVIGRCIDRALAACAR